MPAPITIQDPATYYESQKYPSASASLGLVGLVADPVVPLRSFLSMQRTGGAQPSRGDDESSNEATRRNKRHMDDISMSPRLLGYVFSCISSAVCMISSTIFLFQGTSEATKDSIENYFAAIGIPVSGEKMEMASQRIEDSEFDIIH